MAKDIIGPISKVTFEDVEISLQGAGGGGSEAEVFADFIRRGGTFQNTTYTELDLSGVDTSGIYSMMNMFNYMPQLTRLDISNFDTSSVFDMSNMFNGCMMLPNLDVSNFNTSNVILMNSMFSNCAYLTNLDVSNFNTSNVTDMANMFNGCYILTSLDVSNFNTSNVTNMYGMFDNCFCLTNLDVSNFDTSKVTDMNSMFHNCSNLTSLDVSNFDTSNVRYMSHMFSGCSNVTSLDVSNFDTSNVNEMHNMFGWCQNITYLDISSFSYKSIFDTIYDFIVECPNLYVLKLGLEIPPVMGGLLTGCPIQKILIPKGMLEVYQNATNWNSFAQFMEEYDIPETTYVFVTDDGSSVETITTNEGISTAPITTPNDTSLIFNGWYLDSNFSKKVSFPYQNIKGGTITMYAKYAEPAPISRVMAKTINPSDLGVTTFNTTITDDNEPSFAGGNGWKAAWYKITPEVSGYYYINDYMHDYITSPIFEMEVVIENEDGSAHVCYIENWNNAFRQYLEAGKTYYYAIAAWGGMFGTLDFKLSKE